MKLLLALLVCTALSACTDDMASNPSPHATTPDTDAPKRVVSLDVCADQYVLKFVTAEHILAVSPDAAKPFSYMADAAQGLPSVRPSAEDVVMLKPDLVVRSYGGGPNAEAVFARAGIPVVTLGWAATLDDIQTNVLDMATILGAADEGRDVVAEMQRRMSALTPRKPNPRAVYITPSGATSGHGTLIHDLMQAAGLENYETRSGWQSLPLERLVHDTPDLVVTAFFDSTANNLNGWASSRHPIAQRLKGNRGSVHLPGAWTSCNGWFTLNAVEAMAKGTQ